MGAMDTATRRLMSRNDVAADLLNLLIHQGEPKIQPGDLSDADASEILLVGGHPATAARHRDGMKRMVIKRDARHGAAFCFIGIENQAAVSYDMPVRLLVYDAARYDSQLRAVRRQGNDSSGNEKRPSGRHLNRGGEFICGLPKGTRLIPVIDIVIYWGQDVWDGPRSLRDMQGPIPPELAAFVQDYKLNLVVPAELDDGLLDRLGISLKAVLGAAKHQGNRAELTSWARRAHLLHQVLDEETMAVMNALGGKRDVPLFSAEEGRDTMCKAYDEMFEDGKREGRTKGLEEGLSKGLEKGRNEERARIARALLAKGDCSMREIAELTCLSLYRVRKLAAQARQPG
jgi:Flagellar biosynthesis/type III secretory pathway protein